MDRKVTWENGFDEFFQAINSNWYQARKLLIHIKIDKAYLSCDPKSNRSKSIPSAFETSTIYVFGHSFFPRAYDVPANMVAVCVCVHHVAIAHTIYKHKPQQQQKKRPIYRLYRSASNSEYKIANAASQFIVETVFCSLNIEISFPLSIILSSPYIYRQFTGNMQKSFVSSIKCYYGLNLWLICLPNPFNSPSLSVSVFMSFMLFISSGSNALLHVILDSLQYFFRSVCSLSLSIFLGVGWFDTKNGLLSRSLFKFVELFVFFLFINH